jgi:FxLD family lantipeptide
MTMDVHTSEVPVADASELDLDVSIVEQGEGVDSLLCTTDNGCSTNKNKDC